MGTLRATREELYAAIERERAYQKQKWPEANLVNKPLDVYGRMIVAHEELKEARLAWCKSASNDNALRELLQCVTVGVAWCESENIQWHRLASFYTKSKRTLPHWLEGMTYRFALAGSEAVFLAEDTTEPQKQFEVIIAMGMAALLQHGIVEREEFLQPKAEAKKEGMRMFPEAKAYLDILESYNVLNPSARVLNPDRTPRTSQGLFFMRFKDHCNTACTLQKSSLLTENAILLGMEEYRMFLTQQDVLALLPFLIRFAETGELDAL